MTYCVAMCLDLGMIFASDSRTNAGVDQIAKFSKMRVFAREGERVIIILSSGNLSVTQNAVNILEQRAKSGENALSLWNATSMFDVARLLGDALREVKQRDGPYLAQNNIDSSANFIVGLLEATKCTMVSFDSTMRSNISVGLPIDLVVYETDALKLKLQRRIEESDPYFQMVHKKWGEGLRSVFAQLPNPDWV